MITQPTRTLAEIRSDLMKLERERSHHFGYALDQDGPGADRERADQISDAATDMHHAACKLSVFVYPLLPR